MRKNFIMVLLGLGLILSCSLTAFAAESETSDSEKQPTEIGVSAKYTGNIEGEYSCEITEGSASLTTEEGVTVTVTGASEGAVHLVVFPFPASHTEAWGWIMDCLEGTGIPVHAYDIYFEDLNGNHIHADGAIVTISCSHCDGDVLVCSLDTDGTIKVLETSTHARSGMITFATNGSAYYVLAEKEAAAPGNDGDTTPAPDNGNGGNDGDDASGEQPPAISPETGKDGNVPVWFLLMIFGAALVVFGYGRRFGTI